MNVSYERNKSCLDGCDEYDKHIYGWYGALQRQLQRSQYHMQYSRPVQVVSSVILLMFLLGELLKTYSVIVQLSWFCRIGLVAKVQSLNCS